MPDTERFNWDLRHLFGSREDDWYASLFDLVPDGQLPGEITPAYAGLDDATVEAVHDIAPNARLIYLLRNPIDRVWSRLALTSLTRQMSDPHDLEVIVGHAWCRLHTNRSHNGGRSCAAPEESTSSRA